MTPEPDSRGRRRSRRPAVAGSFYPDDPDELAALVDGLLAPARPPGDAVAAAGAGLAGILVPHAGLVYSGRRGRRLAPRRGGSGARERAAAATTLVLLGTNHRAGLAPRRRRLGCRRLADAARRRRGR